MIVHSEAFINQIDISGKWNHLSELELLLFVQARVLTAYL